MVPDDRCLRERSSGGPGLWFLPSVKGEEITFAAHGNEALVQNELLFKFCTREIFYFVYFSFSPKVSSETSL